MREDSEKKRGIKASIEKETKVYSETDDEITKEKHMRTFSKEFHNLNKYGVGSNNKFAGVIDSLKDANDLQDFRRIASLYIKKNK